MDTHPHTLNDDDALLCSASFPSYLPGTSLSLRLQQLNFGFYIRNEHHTSVSGGGGGNKTTANCALCNSSNFFFFFFVVSDRLSFVSLLVACLHIVIDIMRFDTAAAAAENCG